MDKLLIVDDNEDIRKQLKWGLGRDYSVILAQDRSEALGFFRRHLPRVVTLDLGLLPDADGTSEGFECLHEMLLINPEVKVIVLTGNDERANALRAVQIGAYDYIQKPVEIDTLRVVLQRAFYLSSLERENKNLQTSMQALDAGLNGMIGQCPQMLQVFATIRKVAPSDAAVLLTGESGTGKELVARALHSLSPRAKGPFVPINCGAIPENLLESELFGFEKGAFTGAHTRVQGKVEYAHSGTLFLDELTELPANLQVKLLRFLQEKVIQRVGGREDIPADIRILSASNRDIQKAIQDGEFREDLYYRIAVLSITVPPLRERGDDIMLLANFFLQKFMCQFGKRIEGLSPEALELMRRYDWPGNVRELENRIQRAVIMSDSALLEPDDLDFTTASLTSGGSGTLNDVKTLKDARDRVERDMIRAALNSCGGSMAKAAENLGISRPTLYDLVKKHGL